MLNEPVDVGFESFKIIILRFDEINLFVPHQQILDFVSSWDQLDFAEQLPYVNLFNEAQLFLFAVVYILNAVHKLILDLDFGLRLQEIA